jgi:WD40 repeat protein
MLQEGTTNKQKKESNVVAEKLAEITGHSGSVYALCKGSSSDSFFSSGSDRYIVEWSLKDFTQTGKVIIAERPVYSLEYIAEQNLLLIGNDNGGIHFVDLPAKNEIKLLQLHKGQVFDLKYNPKTGCLYSASADGSIAMVDLKTYETKIIQLCPQKVRQLAFNPALSLLAVASGDGIIRVFNAQDLTLIKSFPGHELSANSVCFHPNKNLLISGGRDAYIKAWDMEKDYSEVKSIPAHNYAIYGMEFSKDGKYFFSAGRDKTIKIWDALSLDIRLRIDRKNYLSHTHSVNRILLHPETGLLISGSDDRKLMVWNIRENQ